MPLRTQLFIILLTAIALSPQLGCYVLENPDEDNNGDENDDGGPDASNYELYLAI